MVSETFPAPVAIPAAALPFGAEFMQVPPRGTEPVAYRVVRVRSMGDGDVEVRAVRVGAAATEEWVVWQRQPVMVHAVRRFE